MHEDPIEANRELDPVEIEQSADQAGYLSPKDQIKINEEVDELEAEDDKAAAAILQALDVLEINISRPTAFLPNPEKIRLRERLEALLKRFS